MRRADVYLVPGFFGFANLGKLTYFGHVRRSLLAEAAARGVAARIHVVRTNPTASLTRRAAVLAETIARTAGEGSSPIHIVGHSSGGMDARLVTSPGVHLPTSVDVERLMKRVRSVVTVATPHHGTPLATFFASRLGQQVLQAISVSTIHVLRYGHMPLRALLQFSAALTRVDTLVFDSTLLDHVFETVLGDFSVGRRRAVSRLFTQIASDQSLLTQLTPEATALFNATVLDREAVRCGCVVTRSAVPGVASARATGLDPAAQAIHTVYATLYGLAARTPRAAAAPATPQQARVLRAAYGKLPGAGANDGIVPTRSQVWGNVVAAVTADHLDVIGHFGDPSAKPPHVDWLTTGSGFTRDSYQQLWSTIADFVFGGAG